MSDYYTVLGLMSGTSLDGTDLACCRFRFKKNKWEFEITAAETKPFTINWKNKLKTVMYDSAYEYALTDIKLGNYFGKLINDFVKKNRIKPDFISSHGHTVFHQPSELLTSQIGSGGAIAAVTRLPVVCDFRITDVSKKGQGAPLVPAGDRLLFKDYDFCINLGGIANISYEQKNKRIAFDICPVNMALNYLAQKTNHEYDKDGRLAANGKINSALLKNLNALAYYKKQNPKSLGAEWFENYFKPLIDQSEIPVSDKLATVTEHICMQIKTAIKSAGNKSDYTMLVTGGGAFNKYLAGRMKTVLPVTLVFPTNELIEFKEAMIFAFLGLLRWKNEINTYASVTGAESDSSSGAVFLP